MDKKELIKDMLDSGDLLCELQRSLTKARKAYIYPSLDKKAKKYLETAESDEFLFGKELTQRLKSAKVVEKAGLSLKNPQTEKKAFRPPALNWRGPPAKMAGPSPAGSKQRYVSSQRGAFQSKPQSFNRPKYQTRAGQQTNQSTSTNSK